jgi:hypothetical protein
LAMMNSYRESSTPLAIYAIDAIFLKHAKPRDGLRRLIQGKTYLNAIGLCARDAQLLTHRTAKGLIGRESPDSVPLA